MDDSRRTVSGGREIAYTDSGDPGGACLFFFFPGAPQSRLRILMLTNDRLICADDESIGVEH